MWEIIHEEGKSSGSQGFRVERKKIAGGWLIRVTQQVPDKYVFSELGGRHVPSEPIVTITFTVDPNHVWEVGNKK